MTCIVAVAEGGVVTMGGDSAGVGGWQMMLRDDVKVFKRGPFIIGFTTSFRMGQILRYKLTTPDHPDRLSDHEYLSTVFVNAVRNCLRDGGWKKTENEREQGGTFLVGYRGCVYAVDSDFQVGIPSNGFWACGCGDDLALGSMHATEHFDIPPRERIEMALTAAEAMSAGVRGPFEILEHDG